MVNYAESNSDLAILAINTLQKAGGPLVAVAMVDTTKSFS